MKCDQFISNYEAGSALDRLRAKAHARRCPRCAATREWLTQVQRQLHEPPELTPFHRRVWEQTAAEGAPQPIRHWIFRPRLAVAGGLAIAAFVVIALVLSLRRDVGPDNNGSVARRQNPPVAGPIETQPLQVSPKEIAQLETDLDRLAADLDRLAEEAARVEARRALGKLVAQHQPLESGDST